MTNQKKGIKTLLIIATALIILILILMWSGFGTMTNKEGNEIESTSTLKIIMTLGALILIFLGWILFKHQKNRDIKNATRIHTSK